MSGLTFLQVTLAFRTMRPKRLTLLSPSMARVFRTKLPRHPNFSPQRLLEGALSRALRTTPPMDTSAILASFKETKALLAAK
jgi:hypothetical protein